MHTYIYIHHHHHHHHHMTHQPTQIRTELTGVVSGNNLNHKASIIPSVFAKLNLQNWKSYSTDDTKFIHGTITRKKLLGVEEGRVGGIRIHVQTRRGGRSRRFRDLDQDIKQKILLQSLTHNKQRTVAYFNYIRIYIYRLHTRPQSHTNRNHTQTAITQTAITQTTITQTSITQTTITHKLTHSHTDITQTDIWLYA
jgi:hypothetical protein